MCAATPVCVYLRLRRAFILIQLWASSDALWEMSGGNRRRNLKAFRKEMTRFERWIFSFRKSLRRFFLNAKSFWVPGVFDRLEKEINPNHVCVLVQTKQTNKQTKACELFFRKQLYLSQLSYKLGPIGTFYSFLENSILYAWKYQCTIIIMSFWRIFLLFILATKVTESL